MKAGTKLHLATMVSVCALLAGCETSSQQSSAMHKSSRVVSGEPRLAAPGNAVAALMLPQTPTETLYQVVVAYEPPVDPVLAAQAVDPSQVPGAVPVPRPSPNSATAMAMATQVPPVAGAPVNTAANTVAGTPLSVAAAPAVPGTPTVPGSAAAPAVATAAAVPSPVAAKGARPGAPAPAANEVASIGPYMLPDAIAPQSVVPPKRPGDALGYASPGAPNAALAAIDAGTSNAMRNSAYATAPASAMRNDINAMVTRYSTEYGVPESLIHRVIQRESKYDAAAVHRSGRYWGLMQILPATARSMGYQGDNKGLLNAETNLKYAVKYLRGAYLVADKNHDQAVRLYARGYYFDAKRKGMLDVLK